MIGIIIAMNTAVVQGDVHHMHNTVCMYYSCIVCGAFEKFHPNTVFFLTVYIEELQLAVLC